MTEPELVRRLTTIMDIDVVGFSSMSARDEEHALGLLGSRMATAQTLVKHHRGRVFKLTGDGLLAEFASPVEAVRAALEIQEAMRAANDGASPADQLVLRIGVNLGDVVESGDDLLGDAVNVAARLESIAAPGGICVAAAVYEQIQGKLTLGAEDMGEQHVKNIPRAIHAYRLTIGNAPSAPPPVNVQAPPASRSPRIAIALGVAAVVALLALGGAWMLHERSQPVPSRVRTAEAPAPSAAAAATTVPAPSPPPAAPAARQAAPAAPQAAPSETTATAPAPPEIATPKVRVYSVADVPFVSDFRRGRLEDYARAEDFKAMAINSRGWFAIAAQRINVATARRAALEDCNALVAREVTVPRPFDHCMLYAVGNDVVWAFREPPMPPSPYVPAARLSPPVIFDAAAVPLINEPARRNLAAHYAHQTRPRALVLGHSRFEWWTPGDSESDAIRRTLQICGHISGRPCIVYSVNENVVVRVPQLNSPTDVFTPQALNNLDAGQKAAVESYLVANDWRAIAVAGNGRLGIVSGRASETAAAADAISECTRAGGADCVLTAVGPYLVAPR